MLTFIHQIAGLLYYAKGAPKREGGRGLSRVVSVQELELIMVSINKDLPLTFRAQTFDFERKFNII